MNEVILTGLDGSNPLGFMAAIGLLKVVSQHLQQDPSLSWSEDYHPILRLAQDTDIPELILSDIGLTETSEVLILRHVKKEKNGPKSVGTLVPQVAVLRRWLDSLLRAQRWEALEQLAGLMTDSVVESDNDLPDSETLETQGVSFVPSIDLTLQCRQTPFDFTSRNTQFLDQVRQILAFVDREAIENELFHGAASRSANRTMNWDPLFDRPGALFSGQPPRYFPTLEWLMYRALCLFPLFPTARGLSTPGVIGRRKEGELRWPLWRGFVPVSVVRSILALPEAALRTPQTRDMRGIFAAFSVRLMKTADGYDGAFGISQPLR